MKMRVREGDGKKNKFESENDNALFVQGISISKYLFFLWGPNI